MKNLYLSGLALIASIITMEQSHAQLTAAQLAPVANDSIIEYNYGGSFVIDPGSAGDNQNWDYSTKIGTVYSTYQYQTCPIAVNCNMFPTNTLMSTRRLASSQNTQTYYFYDIESNGINALGYYQEGNGNIVSTGFYTEPKKILQFPLNYGATWNVPFHDSSATTSGGYTYIYNGSSNYVVDARGSVKTNVGTYTNAYRVKVISTGTTTTISTFNGQTQTTTNPIDSSPIYYWYAADNHSYILSISNNNIGIGSLNYTRTFLAPPVTGVGNIDALASQLSIYPNPSSEIANIKANDLKIKEVTLFNIAGQNMKEVHWNRINDQSGFINIANLPTGMYVVRINTAEGVVNKKFSVIH